MSSAFYNLSMHLHRQAVEGRLSSVSAGQSFLSRQRQHQANNRPASSSAAAAAAAGAGRAAAAGGAYNSSEFVDY